MLFWFQSNGNRQQVIIKTQSQGSEWLASAVLFPLTPGKADTVLRMGGSKTVVQLLASDQKEAIEKMATILKNIYGCTPVE